MNRWKRLVNMAVAHIRRHADEANFEIVFRYQNTEIGIDRVFNFQRNISETVGSTLNRIKTNIEKEHNKKLRKSKKDKSAPSTSGSNNIEVDLLIEKNESTTWLELLEKMNDNNFKESKLRVCGQDFKIAYNYPYVSQLTMPSIILVDFDCYPAKFEVTFTERNKCSFEWYRGLPSENKNDSDIVWSKCEQNGFFYHVQKSDLRHKLKVIIKSVQICSKSQLIFQNSSQSVQFVCIPKSETLVGPKVEAVSNCLVEAGPGYNAFEEKQKFTPTRLDGAQFRVMSYNLLADYYADSEKSRTELFPYCPPFALAIDYRKLLFIREILGYHADICCFQEVDAKVFDLDLTICLGNDGMEGLLQKKGSTSEGVATFYHRDKFSLVQSYGFNLGENIPKQPYFQELYEKIKGNEKLCERMLALSTALQVTVLKSKVNDQYLIVANTHLYFHPDADHIRLLQIGFFMLYVKHIYRSTIADLNLSEQQMSIIFCGDFNSVPECGIYKLMTEQFVPDDFIDFQSSECSFVCFSQYFPHFNLFSFLLL